MKLRFLQILTSLIKLKKKQLRDKIKRINHVSSRCNLRNSPNQKLTELLYLNHWDTMRKISPPPSLRPFLSHPNRIVSLLNGRINLREARLKDASR